MRQHDQPEIGLSATNGQTIHEAAVSARLEVAIANRNSVGSVLRRLKAIDRIARRRHEFVAADIRAIVVLCGQPLDVFGALRVPRDLLDDIKNRVDSINTFPAETEKPVIALRQRMFPVISVVIAGDYSESEIRMYAERVRDDLMRIDGITQRSGVAGHRDAGCRCI